MSDQTPDNIRRLAENQLIGEGDELKRSPTRRSREARVAEVLNSTTEKTEQRTKLSQLLQQTQKEALQHVAEEIRGRESYEGLTVSEVMDVLRQAAASLDISLNPPNSNTADSESVETTAEKGDSAVLSTTNSSSKEKSAMSSQRSVCIAKSVWWVSAIAAVTLGALLLALGGPDAHWLVRNSVGIAVAFFALMLLGSMVAIVALEPTGRVRRGRRDQ